MAWYAGPRLLDMTRVENGFWVADTPLGQSIPTGNRLCSLATIEEERRCRTVLQPIPASQLY